MKIRAAVLEEMGRPTPYAVSRPLRVDMVDLAPPGPGEILVRIAAAGLCHSDLSVIKGDRPRPMPMALGHEASGVVEELGPDVAGLQPGDHVVLVFVPSCGQCLPCQEGRPALCEPAAAANAAGTLLSGARRLSRGNREIHHHIGMSAFAEYAVVSARSAIKIDRDQPLEIASLFGCAVLTGVGAVVNTAGLRPGMTAAVVGLGGVGLSCLIGAQAAGAARIIGIDLADDKLAKARELGATDTFNAGAADCVEAVREATRGGVDHAFEFAGSARAMELAYRVTRRGGVTTTAGLPPPSAAFAVPHVNLVAEERTIKGSYIGTAVPRRDLPRYMALYARGRLPVDKLLTHRLALDDINEGFDRLNEGRAIRQIVAF
jgi:alcohol dehydrogenase